MKDVVRLVCIAFMLTTWGCRKHSSTVDVTTAAWDDLSVALNIKPFYVAVDSPVRASSLSIEIDLYDEGELQRTFLASTFRHEHAQPLNVKAAIYFMPPQDGTIKGAVSILWQESIVRSGFSFQESEFPITHASFAHRSGIASPPERLPLFAMVVGEKGVYLPAELSETPKANANSKVLIGYLKTE